jgi:hypothetical protein
LTTDRKNIRVETHPDSTSGLTFLAVDVNYSTPVDLYYSTYQLRRHVHASTMYWAFRSATNLTAIRYVTKETDASVLLGSTLRLIEPTLEDLDEYFDTPAHALFAANRITNFENLNPRSAELITVLEKHADLFGQGAQSEALAIPLMRASTRMGAPEMTLRYANRIPPGAAFRETAEYNWLVGIMGTKL